MIITTIKEYKEYLIKNRINEGGGAGIDFTIEDVSRYLTLNISKDNIEIVNDDYSVGGIIKAKGYDDGGIYENEIELDVSLDNNKIYKFLKTVKLNDLEEDLEDEIIKYSDLSLFDFINNTNYILTFTIEISNATLNKMWFAGWTRGSFEIGGILLSGVDVGTRGLSYYSNINLNIGHIEFNHINDNSYLDLEPLLQAVTPNIIVNQDFLDWYRGVFIDKNYDDEEY